MMYKICDENFKGVKSVDHTNDNHNRMNHNDNNEEYCEYIIARYNQYITKGKL